ncbi:MAG: protein kinase [Holophagales bacterium]|nr:protein kinase [Holophagales bacterium]
MALSSGTHLGPYEILAPLGAGGMGEVWRARDTRLGREVAIKVLPDRTADDPKALARFQSEAKAIAALSHPNILALHDVGEANGIRFAVTELLQGETLRALVARGPVPTSRAVEIAHEIAEGLAAAHEKGIVHRDLKPENVFLTKGGHAKILDFGLAHHETTFRDPNDTHSPTVSALTDAGAVLGTVGYMAPEQVRGLPCDHHVDVFAFGCVLHEMLSGRRPFVGKTPADALAAILSADPPPLGAPGREIPPALQGIVGRCLEKAPGDRFQSTRDLAFHLGQLARLSGVGSGATAPIPGMPKPVRRRVLVAAAVLAALVLVGLGSAILGRRSVESPTVRATRLTFRRGYVTGARFAPGGQTVVYSASWGGAPSELYSLRLGSPEATPLGYTKAELLSVSSTGELALLRLSLSPLDWWRTFQRGGSVTLARAPLSGGTPKDLDERVSTADFSPDGGTMAVGRFGETPGVEYPLGSAVKKAAVAGGGGAAGLRISRDGRRVAFFTGADLRLLEADGTIRKLAGKTTWVTGLGWSPRDDELWYSDGNELRAVTPAGRQRVVYTHLGNLELHDVDVYGRVLAAAHEVTSRVFFRSVGDTADHELPWLAWTVASDLSPDGRLMAFTEDSPPGTSVSEGSVVYLRETSGAPPMKLGEGFWPRISTDGQLVAAVGLDGKEVVIYPVGAGPVTRVPLAGFIVHFTGLLPDGRTVWFIGQERPQTPAPQQGKGPGLRLWLTDLAGASPRAVTPEGVNLWTGRFTPDGTHVAGSKGKTELLFPLAGGEPVPLNGIEPGERIVGFEPDSRAAFVCDGLKLPVAVFRVDLRTGKRELIREITPADRSGIGVVANVSVRMSADGKSYLYGFHQMLSDLYLIEGLR